MGFDWKKTLGAVAPALATALGGPMAGMAAAVAIKKLGGQDVGEDQNIENIAAAVASGDPGVFVRLREAEQEYLLDMKRLDLDHEKLHQADRTSARELATNVGMHPQIVLSGIYTLGYFALLYVLLTGQLQYSDQHRELVAVLLGVMTKAQSDIMQFWFGSSAGSKEKSAAIR